MVQQCHGMKLLSKVFGVPGLCRVCIELGHSEPINVSGLRQGMPSLAAATPGFSIAFKNNIVLGRSHYTDTSMKFQSIKFNMYHCIYK